MLTNFKRYVPAVILILLFIFFVYLLKQNTAILFARVSYDPLFYISFVDTIALAGSVSNLREQETRVLRSIHERIDAGTAGVEEAELDALTKLIDQGFIPADYLATLPRSIEATDRFLARPSIANALMMNLYILRSAKAYQKESVSLYGLVGAAHAARPFVMGMISARSRTSQIVSDIALVEQNGEALRTEARTRFWCLFALRCMLPVTISSPSPASEPMLMDIHEYELLPDEMVNLDFQELERFGPYLIESSCFPEKYTPMYLYTNFEDVFIAKDATDNYYYDISTSSNAGGNTFVNALSEMGIRYYSQPEGSNYRCFNLKYWGDLSAIHFFNIERNMKEITSSYDLDILRQELENTQDAQTKADLLLLDNRLLHLPLMLATVHRYLEVLDSQLQQYTAPIQPIYLSGMRSNYALLYQTFARSVWRLSESPLYESEKNLPVAPNYTTYTELRDQFSHDEIKAFHEKQNP